MVVASELKIIGKLDIEQIKVGLSRVKNDVKRTTDEAKKSFFEFDRMSKGMKDAIKSAKWFGVAALAALTGIALKAPSLAGAMAEIKVSLFRITEAVGKALKPEFEWLASKLEKVATFMETHPGFTKFIGRVLELGAAFLGLTLIIAVVKKVFNVIKYAWIGVGSIFKGVWTKIIKPVFTAIKTSALWLWNTILKPFIGWIGAVWSKVSGFFTAIPTWLSTAAGTAGIIGGFGLSQIIRTYGEYFGWIKKKGAMLTYEEQVAMGQIGGYQQGGFVPRTGLALLHQGETVIPAGKKYFSNYISINITTGAISKEIDVDSLATTVGKKVVENLNLYYR